jgi:hypothetical protein
MTLRLLQHVGVDGTRSVIAATSEEAAFVIGVDSVRALAERAIADGTDLAAAVAACGTGDSVDIAAELAAGRLTSPIDHIDPAHLIMTGTGLTHLGSAEGRDKMHRAAADAEKQTDSMRMFLEGVEGGKPAAGDRGQQPEWFYKGDGSGLVAPGAAFAMPDFAEDGGEEPELAGIYLIGPDGTPVPPRPVPCQRVQRSRHGAAQLPLARALQATPGLAGTGIAGRYAARAYRGCEPHSS